MKKTILITVIIAVIVGGLGFLGGIEYQKRQIKTFTKGSMFNGQEVKQAGQGRGNQKFVMRGQAGLMPINGSITAKDDKTITVKMQDGSSKIVILSNSTKINEITEAAISKLTIGATIAAFGKENSDGSITAQNIQLNPNFQNKQKE